MLSKRADVLLNTMMVIEIYSLNRALNELSQAEFDWEPHPGAWGIRRRDQATTADPLGSEGSEFVADYDLKIDEASMHGELPPMSTIGWLLNHFGAAPRAFAELTIVGGQVTPTPEVYQRMWNHTIVATADDAVARVRDGWKALDAALRGTTDEMLEANYDGHPWIRGDLACTAMLNEVSHHATQVCTLRDMYAYREGGR
jgi:hypothetical protein